MVFNIFSYRNELVAAQLRLATTMAQIKNIELKQLEDSSVVRRKQRENELAHQQLLMKQQKESEFMREIQLCRLRHLTEVKPRLILLFIKKNYIKYRSFSI